jgi:hypothetical protein
MFPRPSEFPGDIGWLLAIAGVLLAVLDVRVRAVLRIKVSIGRPRAGRKKGGRPKR